jgi:hypothetical protein
MATANGFEDGAWAMRGGRGRLGAWLRDGWRLFRATPLRGIGLALLPMAVEGLLQLVPVVGMVASKLATPLAGMWVLSVLHQRAITGAFAPRIATRRWTVRLPVLLSVSALSSLVFGVQLLVVVMLAGVDQAKALLVMDLASLRLSRLQMAWMLASGVVPATLLFFVPAQATLSGRGLADGLRDSLAAAWTLRRPMLGMAALSVAALMLLPWQPWLLLAYLPVSLYVGYAAWADTFGEPVSSRRA